MNPATKIAPNKIATDNVVAGRMVSPYRLWGGAQSHWR